MDNVRAEINRLLLHVGVLGIRLLPSPEHSGDSLGVELVAGWHPSTNRRKELNGLDGVACYDDYDDFLRHEMDAVILANNFNEHGRCAIKALRAGKHVLCETSACKTVQEGVELIETVEATGLTYMMAENYPYFNFNQEMKALYQQGAIGDVRYAEGEYNHPTSLDNALKGSPGLNRWNNILPATYFNTHALSPLMYITDTMPIRVNALAIRIPDLERMSIRRGDPGFAIFCRMDNGAVFRLFGKNIGGFSIYFRLHGTRGMMENVRNSPERLVHVNIDKWNLQAGEQEDRVYPARFPSHAEEAKVRGHGAGDFWTLYHFVEAIRTGAPPYLNVYRAVTMSAVGILAWKSALEEGVPYDIPDFTDAEVRRRHAQDDWSPWPEDRRPGQPYASIRGDVVPTPEAVEYATAFWKKNGLEFD
jgi:predicted dehydrogenase